LHADDADGPSVRGWFVTLCLSVVLTPETRVP
jgi:hypothetical protein